MKYSHFILMCLLGTIWSQAQPNMNYQIDVTQNLDTFFVELNPDAQLYKNASIYQFAATAPGTYQTMNIGRFVSDFRAFDSKGKELKVGHLSVNQFEISKPQKVSKVTYKVAETFDTKVDTFPIYTMCGSSIEEDHALINTHTMIGYFEGYQKSKISLELVGNPDWSAGSALEFKDGRYWADDFDRAVDSPILTGVLSKSDTIIGDTPVEIFCYSKNNKIYAEDLLEGMADMLGAAQQFLIELPVDRYTFLYFFEPNPPGVTGAWEHSYSSEYVINEFDPTPAAMAKVTDIASHEFFHIVTPLNIHSEIIESFNFVQPTPSVHLWLYEGVTEWASNILMYRGGAVSEEFFFENGLSGKISVMERVFDGGWSLKKISDESFNGGEAAKQYYNIYYKGALVAGLLDIRLLELSKGTYGLRELLLDLIQKYGKGQPVSEATFFDDITAMTYPEIRGFFDSYVLSDKALPLEPYLDKIGLKLTRDNGKVKVEKLEYMTPDQQLFFEAWSKNLARP